MPCTHPVPNIRALPVYRTEVRIPPPAASVWQSHRHHIASSLIKEHSTSNWYVKKYGCLISLFFGYDDLIVPFIRFPDVAMFIRENL